MEKGILDMAKSFEKIRLAVPTLATIVADMEETARKEIAQQQIVSDQAIAAKRRLMLEIGNIQLAVNEVMRGKEFQELILKISEQMRDFILETLGPLYTRGDGEILVTAVIEDIMAKTFANLGKEYQDL